MAPNPAQGLHITAAPAPGIGEYRAQSKQGLDFDSKGITGYGA